MRLPNSNSYSNDWLECRLGRRLWGYPKLASFAFYSALADVRRRNQEEREIEKSAQSHSESHSEPATASDGRHLELLDRDLSKPPTASHGLPPFTGEKGQPDVHGVYACESENYPV